MNSGYDNPIIKKYKLALETCFCKWQIDDCIPINFRIYNGATCYAFNDIYDQVKILADLKRDSEPKYFEHIMKNLWEYFEDVNLIYRYYWEIEKPVPKWFDKKYHPLMIPLSESELSIKEKLKESLSQSAPIA